MITRPVPPTLRVLQPLLQHYGYELSNHISIPVGSEHCWSIVKKGKAGRACMTAEEAEKEVVSLLLRKMKEQDERWRTLQESLAALIDPTIPIKK